MSLQVSRVGCAMRVLAIYANILATSSCICDAERSAGTIRGEKKPHQLQPPCLYSAKSHRRNWEARRLGFLEWLASLAFSDTRPMVTPNPASNDDPTDILDHMIAPSNDALALPIVLFEGI